MTDKEKIEVLEKENKLLKEQIELLKELKQKNTPTITTYPSYPYYPYYPYYDNDHREWWDHKVYCNTPLDQCTSTSVTAKTGDAE